MEFQPQQLNDKTEKKELVNLDILKESLSSSASSIAASDATYDKEINDKEILEKFLPVAPQRHSLLSDLPSLVEKKPTRAVEFQDPLHHSIPRIVFKILTFNLIILS